MPGIVGPLVTSVADNRPKQTFIPKTYRKKSGGSVTYGDKYKDSNSIGDKNTNKKKQGIKFVPP